MTTQSRGLGILVRRRWARELALAGVAALVPAAAPAQQPAAKPAAKWPAPSDYDKRVVAFIYGGTGVTRQDLGEFLLARGGMDKIDLLVNKKIIETEAARRGASVTSIEVTAALGEDIGGLGVTLDVFEQTVLPRYGKTLYEWTEDVIRPRLLLSKMCRDRITVTDAEVQKAFETKYGEKREAQIVVWPKGDPKHPALSPDVKATAVAKAEEFEKLAANQPNEFAKSRGIIAPIGRHIEGEDPRVEAALFSLKVGEMVWVESETKSTGIRCGAIHAPDPKITLAAKRGELEKEVADKKFGGEIPRFFEELKKQAAPALTEHVPLRPAGSYPADAKPVRVPFADPRVLAVCYGTVTVTREDLGEFLIARGGYEKLDLLVNKKIIETEAARTGVVISPAEIEEAFAADLKGLGVSKEIFIKDVLPRYGKSVAEWTDDAIRPRLTLGKMCRATVKVTEEDLQRAFESRFGEKRQAKVILWGKAELRAAQKDWDVARKGDAEFDSVARKQRDGTLAAAAGLTLPVGRYADAESPVMERILFDLRVGEISQLFDTPAGIMCVKCTAVLPPQPGVTPAQVRAELEKDVFAKKLDKAIPAYFGELKKVANPNLLLKGPPTARENRDGVDQIIQQASEKVPIPKK